MPIREFIPKQQADQIREAASKAKDVQKADVMELVEPDLTDTDTAVQSEGSLPLDGLSVDGSEPEDVDEAMQDLLLAYFVVCPVPTDKQIHLLAAALALTPEELERHIYQLLSSVAEEEYEDITDAIDQFEPGNDYEIAGEASDDVVTVDP